MLILIRLCGDLTTKARDTRIRFVRKLAANLRDALRTNGIDAEIRRRWSRIYVEAHDAHALAIASRVFGIQSLSVVESYRETRLRQVISRGEQLYRDRVRGKSFAVRARIAREGDSVPAYRSLDLERELGTALRPFAARVDLDSPDVTVQTEIRDGVTYFFTDRIAGAGGLPLGTAGQAVALVSGGFDSAAAAWLMLKRGVALDYVFCRLGGMAHELGARRVLNVLSEQWSYGTRPNLHIVDFQPVLTELLSKGDPRFRQMVLKVLMYRAAEEIARQQNALAIVTGEAVGQVSSQTLPNLAALSQSAAFPVFRPLLGYDKTEIIALAKRIGTHDLSAAVQEYCALTPKYPVTRASTAAVLKEFAKLDPALLEQAVAHRRVLDLRALDVDALPSTELETDRVPSGSVLLDLRPKASFDGWHLTGAQHVEFLDAIRSFRDWDRSKIYLLVCEWGLRSAHLAEAMRASGFHAYSFRAGVRGLIRYAREIGVEVTESSAS